jgi:hypothetical protein
MPVKNIEQDWEKGYEMSSDDNEDYGNIQKSDTKSEICRVGTYTV